MTCILDTIESTSEVNLSHDPFERIIGQEHAVWLVKTAVRQRRHVLLCGPPGVGKSMLAKAAYSLLPPPSEEVLLRHDPENPERPRVVVRRRKIQTSSPSVLQPDETFYVRPEDLPLEVGIRMGYRCPACGSLSLREQGVCIECGASKRSTWDDDHAYLGLFRALDVIQERAEQELAIRDPDTGRLTVFRSDCGNTVRVTRHRESAEMSFSHDAQGERTLVGLNTPRFVRVSGSSPVELLGDVKHDPYGSAESMGQAAYLRVVAGAVHEAHEGIVYVDELAALGPYQKHLLTAMQDRKYPITGHNPHSSGASVRVDDVPCDFLLFAACNIDDLPRIIPPLRSRIRGYGYEIMLASWFEKTPAHIDDTVRFIAETVVEDGRIPHFTVESVCEIIKASEDMALRLDGRPNALTLRLRELGGLVRVSGDLAAQQESDYVLPSHVRQAIALAMHIDAPSTSSGASTPARTIEPSDDYGSYFF
ncbi:MAG: ATP-binding protein [Candidatus Thorarchaeota archaeon]|nr:ATP-binding protein [Candidatus Thorarchaeota archaeon]